jgi:NTE family protein
MTITDKQSVRQSIFLALQGGGAKGVVHVGGIIAINNLDLDIKGIAGTSAGSMVAALVAAGYRGEDLINPKTKNHIFRTVAPKHGFHKATDLFTRNGWMILRFIRYFTRPKPKPVNTRRKAFDIKRLLIIAGILSLLYGMYNFPIATAAVILSALAFCGFKILGGITSVENVRTLIDGALSEKCRPGFKNVTFSDLADAGGLPLKIIATNTFGECLELFCLERTPDVVIADAVAASICLPIIFRPWRFSFLRETEHNTQVVEGNFVDGGLMSNLPAWPFDEERLLYPEATTVALGIRTAVDERFSADKHWLPSVINAIVSGTGEIHTRAVGKIIKIPIITKLGMLDFDADIQKIYQEVDLAEVAVTTQLQQELIENPRLMREATKKISDGCYAILKEFEGKWYRPSSDDKLRVALGVQRAGATQSISLAFSEGYESSHPDNSITLPLHGSIAGDAWAKSSVIAAKIRELPPERIHANDRIWADIQWVLCIPLRYKGSKKAKVRPLVVIIDWSIPIDETLPEAKAEFEKFMRRVVESVVVYTDGLKIREIVQGANSWI